MSEAIGYPGDKVSLLAEVESLKQKLETSQRDLASANAQVDYFQKRLKDSELQVKERDNWIATLVAAIAKESAPEPRHSRENHECALCTVVADLGAWLKSRGYGVMEKKNDDLPVEGPGSANE